MKQIAVLGAGAIGVCVALYLQRDGHEVTLIDRSDPGGGASSGNAGVIQCGSVVPVANVSTLRAVPHMLLDPDQALVIRWRHLLSLMPYLLRFFAESRPERVEHNARALAAIVPKAYDGYRPLIEAAGLGHMVKHSGELHVFETDAAFKASDATRAMRRAHGVPVEVLTGDEARELEPALSPAIRHGAFLPNAYQTADPRKLVEGLADCFVAQGGRFLRAEIRGISARGSPMVRLADGEHRADAVVVALGAFSKPLVKQLAERVPLDSERGYHLTLPAPGVVLGRAVISGEYRFAMTPTGGGIRLAGTAELARVGAPPRYDRARRLLPLAVRVLPGLSGEGCSEWMGHRPSTPDSLPVIGRSLRHPTVYYAFGHGHSGLTLGGITGRLIADLVTGRTPEIDLGPYSIGRFA